MGSTTPDKTTIAVGALSALVGLIPLLAMTGILPPAQHTSADPAPSWMGWLIGLMFLGAGVLVMARGIWGGATESDGSLSRTAPWALRALNDVLGTAIACGLAVLFTWAAFGPGPRHFSVGIGIGGLFLAGPASSDMPGRVMFGFGAALGWLIAALMVRETLRRWRR